MEVKNQFTTRKGNEVEFGRHGFSNEGAKYYKDHVWYLFALDEVRYCGIYSAWDCWTKANCFNYEVIRKKMEEDNMKEDQEHDADADGLILEGDEGDDGFLGWAVAAEKSGRNKFPEEVGNGEEEEENGNGIEDAAVVLATLNPVTPNEKTGAREIQ